MAIWIVVIVVVLLAFPAYIIFKSIIGTKKGLRYWKMCEEEYVSLIASGQSNEEALFEISKKRRPDLADATHIEFVRKFNDIHLIVNFHINSILDKTRANDDVTALKILQNTTIEHQESLARKQKPSFPKDPEYKYNMPGQKTALL